MTTRPMSEPVETMPAPGVRDWREQLVFELVYGAWRQRNARVETAMFHADLAVRDDRMGVLRADH